MMKAPHSHSYPLLSALLFFFFVAWSSSGSLLSIWLHQEVGLKAGDTGIIYAVLSVSALFAQVCYGFIQDKLGLRKHLLWYITSLLILSGPAYLLFGHLLKINVLLGSIFGGIYIGLTFNGGIGVLESYTERVARQSQFEFGRARMWGSLGWAVATFFAGLLFNINPQLNFLVASCSGLVFFILLARLRVDPQQLADALAALQALDWVGQLAEEQGRHVLLVRLAHTPLSPLLQQCLLAQTPATQALWHRSHWHQLQVADVLPGADTAAAPDADLAPDPHHLGALSPLA